MANDDDDVVETYRDVWTTELADHVVVVIDGIVAIFNTRLGGLMHFEDPARARKLAERLVESGAPLLDHFPKVSPPTRKPT